MEKKLYKPIYMWIDEIICGIEVKVLRLEKQWNI